MRAPDGIDRLDFTDGVIGEGGAYPPLGFLPLWDAELGNGDYFGLYWPYGREDREPIVCDMLHDEWGLEIAFSSVSVFLQYLELNDGSRGDEDVEDPSSVVLRFVQAKSLLRSSPQEAIPLLEEICRDFPEKSEYWFSLATQYRRTGNSEAAIEAAVNAFASNWAFGLPPAGVLRLFEQAQPNVPEADLFRGFGMRFGGVKENDDYRRMKDCIAFYLENGRPRLGLLLNQNYGYMMQMETVSFQERYDFDTASWLEQHQLLCKNFLGDSRTAINT